MTIFKTATGSVYEVRDLRARRLIGVTDPTRRIGMDGAWRKLESEPKIVVGLGVLLEWAPGIVPAAVPGAKPATLTSPVVDIVER